MSGSSSRTRIVAYRLPVELYKVLEERCKKNRWETPPLYLRDRAICDINRKH